MGIRGLDGGSLQVLCPGATCQETRVGRRNLENVAHVGPIPFVWCPTVKPTWPIPAEHRCAATSFGMRARRDGLQGQCIGTSGFT